MDDPRKRRCFVIMPFGVKNLEDQQPINFDVVYEFIIRKAIEDMAGAENLHIECVRCDKIEEAGSIHLDMFERIAHDDVAVVDITTANANVFYELGIRHALRGGVTVMIKDRRSRIPFNIQGLRTIVYDHENVDSYDSTREKIRRFVRNGLVGEGTDSPIHGSLTDLDVRIRPTPILEPRSYVYRLVKNPDKSFTIEAGDILAVHGVDVWVNSENTNMQMARFYDGSISGMIRYAGARKDKIGHVRRGGDLIADALGGEMGGRRSVDAGQVIPTDSGELGKPPHRVKRIYHAAAVEGVVGGGYKPVRNLHVCVQNALRQAHTEKMASVLFPLMGTGTGGGSLRSTIRQLFGVAVDFLAKNPASTVSRVSFLAWSDAELKACVTYLDGLRELRYEESEPLPATPKPPSKKKAGGRSATRSTAP